MGLKEDLEDKVEDIFSDSWTEKDGRLVPNPGNLGLGNDAIHLEATVLYADMTASTKLVDEEDWSFAAEVYKAYLTCAAHILKYEDGVITAYDGDRVMAVFIGDSRDEDAVRAGLKLNYAVHDIVNPAIQAHYKTTYALSHVVGIDRSTLSAARIGVKNDNDIVWVGRAANYAAKLSSLHSPGHVYITDDVYNELSDELLYGGESDEFMWEEQTWNYMTVYRSFWRWPL
jgi:class 3 adenylate cyclase